MSCETLFRLAPERLSFEGLPHVFVDRSLGAFMLPGLLRSAGIELTTMAEYYGEELGQETADTDWISEIARKGWIGFHKDDAIRRNEAEKSAVLRSGAGLFCLPNANLSAAAGAQRFLVNLKQIVRASAEPGPYIYSVYLDGIRRIPLN